MAITSRSPFAVAPDQARNDQPESTLTRATVPVFLTSDEIGIRPVRSPVVNMPGSRPIGSLRSPLVANGRLGQVHRTLREAAADEIRDMINRGELQPGERLLEDRLAEQLGVSRNPIREAIRILENTGLVEVTPRRGAHVALLYPVRAIELLELRSVLESFAAQLAAKRGTVEQV